MKISKASADYSAISKNPQTTCGKCQHYKGRGVCEKVSGEVSPRGWCRLFTPRNSLKSMAQRAL